jgi:hypothetical protein
MPDLSTACGNAFGGRKKRLRGLGRLDPLAQAADSGEGRPSSRIIEARRRGDPAAPLPRPKNMRSTLPSLQVFDRTR